VRFDHIRGTAPRHEWGSIVSGLAGADGTVHKITGVTFDDVAVTTRGGLGTIPPDPPEYAGQYPDPNLWGDVPATGIFFRHVDGVSMTNTNLAPDQPDARPSILGRDASGPAF
jgi:hypothetical protein